MIRDIVLLAYLTGLRLGEIIHLMWENLNLEKKLLTIGSAEYKTKSRKQRTVPHSVPYPG